MILTMVSFIFVLVTMPFSLCVTVKVSWTIHWFIFTNFLFESLFLVNGIPFTHEQQNFCCVRLKLSLNCALNMEDLDHVGSKVKEISSWNLNVQFTFLECPWFHLLPKSKRKSLSHKGERFQVGNTYLKSFFPFHLLAVEFVPFTLNESFQLQKYYI